jgi:hypothetical protein
MNFWIYPASQTRLQEAWQDQLSTSGGSLTYSNMESLLSGSGNDTFNSGDDFGIFNLDGGTGTNTLNFSSATDALTIDLGTGHATTGGGDDLTFTNFQDITGGDGDDTFVFTDGYGTLTVDGDTGSDSLDFSAVTTALAVHFDTEHVI